MSENNWFTNGESEEQGHPANDLPNGFHEAHADTQGSKLPKTQNSPPQPAPPKPVPCEQSKSTPTVIDRQSSHEQCEQGTESKICGAKTRSGGRCQKPCIKGRPRCRLHGGLSPIGPAHYKYKHGKRSKYWKDLPNEMRKNYLNALNDPDLHALDDEIGVLQSRLSSLFKKLSDTKPPPWGKAVDALVDYEQARRAKDKDKAAKAFAQLGKAIRQGHDAAAAHDSIWADVMEVINLKGKTAYAAHKRELDLENFAPVDKVLALIMFMIDAVREVLLNRLEDENLARSIAADYGRMIYDCIPHSNSLGKALNLDLEQLTEYSKPARRR